MKLEDRVRSCLFRTEGSGG